MPKLIVGAILGGLLLTAAPPSLAAPPLGITLAGDAMVVSGFEPGAEIVYRFSASATPSGSAEKIGWQGLTSYRLESRLSP